MERFVASQWPSAWFEMLLMITARLHCFRAGAVMRTAHLDASKIKICSSGAARRREVNSLPAGCPAKRCLDMVHRLRRAGSCQQIVRCLQAGTWLSTWERASSLPAAAAAAEVVAEDLASCELHEKPSAQGAAAACFPCTRRCRSIIGLADISLTAGEHGSDRFLRPSLALQLKSTHRVLLEY